MFATVQTVAGCPENCGFCSVWVTDGRQPRQRLADKIIEEVNELYDLGFRYIVFADDNFNPATLGRIAREPSPQKRKELERVREERLRFFEEYDRSVPRNLFAFTQMTTEVTTDEEYLSAMYHKARVRAALIGVESFSEEGLRSANKLWNPTGQKMVETIQKIQDAGILVLSSIICGLESDTVQTIRTMKKFAIESGTIMAQFTVYNAYPGTKDYYEMMADRMNRGKPVFFFNDTATTEIYTLSLHDALPIALARHCAKYLEDAERRIEVLTKDEGRSEEHTSELQSRVDIVCRLLPEKKKKTDLLVTVGQEVIIAVDLSREMHDI